MAPEYYTQDVRLGVKYLYPLSHLPDISVILPMYHFITFSSEYTNFKVYKIMTETKFDKLFNILILVTMLVVCVAALLISD